MVSTELLCCVQKRPMGEICRGGVSLQGDELVCGACGYRYRVVRDVPVMRQLELEPDDDWFEHFFDKRSRKDELSGDYLRHDRRRLAEFVRDYNITGPCLEVGCGQGLCAGELPGFIGLEYSFPALFAEGFEAYDRICGDARVVPVASESMQVVASFNALEHVPDVHLAFDEIDRVVQPGGYLFLLPAWHCTRYNTELIPVLPYGKLNLRQKLTKALLPVIKSRPYKLATKLPRRMWRRLTCRPNNPLSWGRLTPYHGELWISDADATANLDCHEGILFFESRSYRCISHTTLSQKLLAGHDIIILQKPARAANAAANPALARVGA